MKLKRVLEIGFVNVKGGECETEGMCGREVQGLGMRVGEWASVSLGLVL